MFIYNVTVKIDNSVHDEWLEWMKSKHIPDVLATNMFAEAKILRVLTGETDGSTYAIQYSCDDPKNIDEYQNNFAAALQKEHSEKYRDKFVAFRSIMKEVR